MRDLLPHWNRTNTRPAVSTSIVALACATVASVVAGIPSIGCASVIPADPSSLIDVQFGASDGYDVTSRYVGPGVVGVSAADAWNLIAGTALVAGQSRSGIALTSATGASTGATLSFTTPGGFYNASGSGGIFVGTPQANLMTSYLDADTYGTGSGAGAGHVTLSGLAPNAYYEVLTYSAADVVGRGTTFTIGGVSQTVTPTAMPTLALNKSYGEFLAHADGSGTIALTMAAAGTGSLPEANLNGLQIAPVPTVDAHKLFNVQFGAPAGGPATTAYSGPGVVSSVGKDMWNLVTSSGASAASRTVALRDAAGNASTVSLSYSPLSFFNDVATGGGIFAGTPEAALLTSYAFADSRGMGGPATFMFSGLNAGATYELILDSAADAIGRATAFSVDGMTQVVMPSGVPVQGLDDSFAEFMVMADGSGDIDFSMTAYGTGGDLGFSEANLNGIQLIALPATVPEPSTPFVALAGLFGMLAFRGSKPRAIVRAETLSRSRARRAPTFLP